jgi:hypothetical protein
VTIIRITKKQIEEAHKARQAALLKDPEYRLYEELHERLAREAGGTGKRLEMGGREQTAPLKDHREQRFTDEQAHGFERGAAEEKKDPRT